MSRFLYSLAPWGRRGFPRRRHRFIFVNCDRDSGALGASLALGSLAVVGLTGHEVSLERAARSAKDATSEGEGRLAAAA